MLNHAAWVNRENSERRYEATKPDKESHDPLVAEEERKLDSMSPEELTVYMAANWE